MVYFILYYIKFKYSICDYIGEGKSSAHGQMAARKTVSGGDKKATKMAHIFQFQFKCIYLIYILKLKLKLKYT